MSRKTIQKVVNKLYRQFNEQCEKFTKDFDKDELHQLRVNYKKLRATTSMLVPTQPVKRFGFTKKIKKLYHSAGCVRDYQLQYDRILTVASKRKPKAYLKFLKQSIHSFEKEFVSIDSTKQLRKTKAVFKKIVPPEINGELFKLFFIQQWNLVQTTTRQQSFTDEQLHSIRKRIKDIHYNLEIYTAYISTVIPASFPVKNLHDIKSLLDLLGDHQDLHKALELLSPKLVKQFDVDEQKRLADIKLMLMAEKLELKKQAVLKLKKQFTFKEHL